MPSGDFFERTEAKLCSPINMAPRPLAKSPVSFSLGDEVPHIFIRDRTSGLEKNLITVENDFCNKIGTWPTRTDVRDHGESWRVSGPYGGALFTAESAALFPLIIPGPDLNVICLDLG
jgi:hypothetical protein